MSHCDYPKKEVKVYILLDDASDTTSLRIEGVGTELTPNTMSESKSYLCRELRELTEERRWI